MRVLNLFNAFLLVFCALALSACGGGGSVASIIGLDQKQSTPDEFAVVRRAALTLPPDFTLRPPDPAGVREQNLEVRNDARTAVFGDFEEERRQQSLQEANEQGISAGELVLLERSNALSADPNIRATVEQEVAALVDGDEGFVDNLLFWRAEKEQGSDVLDASAEAKRLQENSSLGIDITEGDSPIIRRSEDDPLFNWF